MRPSQMTHAMTRTMSIALAAMTLAACQGASHDAPSVVSHAAFGSARPSYSGIGRAASPQEIAAVDIDAHPDGHGLPAGSGTAADGEQLYAAQCASCHGAKGEGMKPVYPALIGREPRNGFPFADDPKYVHTIGNYWPEAVTVFDYIRRAMPYTAPGSLNANQVYALTAYLLAANEILPMSATLDSASLRAVKMPARDRFVRDDRRGGADVK